jgi:hypothetical protein
MCRYAYSGPYKVHFACFHCRKAFKQPPIEDYLAVQGRGHVYKELSALWLNENQLEQRESEFGVRLADLTAEYHAAERKCPECGELMAGLGLDFKPPRQSDAKAWAALNGMYRVGHEWRSCGCDGPGWVPTSSAEFHQYLHSRKTMYEENLKRIQDSTLYSPEEKAEAGNFWATRIEAVDKELAGVVAPL